MSIRNAMTAIILAFAVAQSAQADTVALHPDHPDKHVVVKGDTLWGIAGRFLRNPWQWPEIWHINPGIQNPHLIYPGDVVTLVYREGQPVLEVQPATNEASQNTVGESAATVTTEVVGTDGGKVVKLSPAIKSSRLENPIPTVPMEVIQPFLIRVGVISPEEIARSGYILSLEEGHLIGGSDNRAYGRDIRGDAKRYNVVRVGKPYRNPGAKEKDILGYEAIQVADAQVEVMGDPATLLLTHSYRETLIGDRLIAAGEDVLNFNFMPRAPKNQVKGQIISVFDAVSRIGKYQVAVVNLGRQSGLEPGDVLAVYRAGNLVRDNVNPKRRGKVALPDVREGVIMIFRSFDKLSYGLVMETTQDIHLFDMVRNP